jgi:hypothetical protein
MAEPTLDASLIGKIVDWLWAIVLAAMGVIYKMNDKKHDEAEKKMTGIGERIDHEVRCVRLELKTKAETDEMNRQRGNIEKLFEGQEEIKQSMNQGFSALQKQMSDTHIVMLEKLNDCSQVFHK